MGDANFLSASARSRGGGRLKFSHAFISKASGASVTDTSTVVAESVLPAEDNRNVSESGTFFFCEIIKRLGNKYRIGVINDDLLLNSGHRLQDQYHAAFFLP